MSSAKPPEAPRQVGLAIACTLNRAIIRWRTAAGVSVAGTLMRQPDLVLPDEPTEQPRQPYRRLFALMRQLNRSPRVQHSSSSHNEKLSARPIASSHAGRHGVRHRRRLPTSSGGNHFLTASACFRRLRHRSFQAGSTGSMNRQVMSTFNTQPSACPSCYRCRRRGSKICVVGSRQMGMEAGSYDDRLPRHLLGSNRHGDEQEIRYADFRGGVVVDRGDVF